MSTTTPTSATAPSTPGGGVPSTPGPRSTYLIVDGENIDATLGMSVLGRRPASEERPRWDRVLQFATKVWDQPVKGLFFLNATSGSMPMGFVQALLAIGFRPIPLAGQPGEKVVDLGIQRTLAAIAERDGDVLLASHDGDFLDDMTRLLGVPAADEEGGSTDLLARDGAPAVGAGRRVGLLAFREFVNHRFTELASPAGAGLKIYDLETDVGAFNAVLPRVRVIPLAEFDPTRYL